MFAMSAFLKEKSYFTGISDLRNKESDRIKEMEKILRQIGIKTKSSSDSLKIWGNIDYSRKSIRVSSLLDHRILMSGLIISQLTGIKGKFKNFETVGTSSPNFLNILKKLGGKCEVKRKVIKIAIDSTAGSGATSLAIRLAKFYKLRFLDTGKVYRWIALKLFEKKPKNKIKFVEAEY